jgi:hypothetical protein
VNTACTNCGGALQHNQPKHGRPASWQCAWCKRSGEYARERLRNGRMVTVRVELRAGDPALHKPWVPAESMPYAERVAS